MTKRITFRRCKKLKRVLNNNAFRYTRPDGKFWSLYQMWNGQWFLTLYEPQPTKREPNAVRMIQETIAPTPYKFVRRDGTVIDQSHRPDSRTWSHTRVKQWARDFIRENS